MDAGRTIRVFASSPGDVADERRQLAVVVQELNATVRALVPDTPIVVELITWEEWVHPDIGRDAQEVVGRQIPAYDVFLGIMWSRFGTPTHVADSGTEEEYRAAETGWRERRSPSHILFYFCRQDYPVELVQQSIDQLKKVGEFRAELTTKGLVWNYPSHASFADTVRPHLVSVVSEIIHAGEPASSVAARTSHATPDNDSALVLDRVKALADEYDYVRLNMSSGDVRTRRMEVIASKMRTLAQAAYPLLPTMTASASAGMRLAAIQVLQSVPDANWLDWLADRLEMSAEKPFVGYHAALALSIAARELEDGHIPNLRRALTRAEQFATRLRGDADRATTLEYAEQELSKREAAASGGGPAEQPRRM